jgi:hypothetical protein
MSFQALPFYLQAGYTVWGELVDMPVGHQRYFLQKALPRGASDGQGAVMPYGERWPA